VKIGLGMVGVVEVLFRTGITEFAIFFWAYSKGDGIAEAGPRLLGNFLNMKSLPSRRALSLLFKVPLRRAYTLSSMALRRSKIDY